MFLDLLDLHPDPYFICADPDPDHSINKQKNKINLLISTVLRLLYEFFSLKNDVNVS